MGARSRRDAPRLRPSSGPDMTDKTCRRTPRAAPRRSRHSGVLQIPSRASRRAGSLRVPSSAPAAARPSQGATSTIAAVPRSLRRSPRTRQHPARYASISRPDPPNPMPSAASPCRRVDLGYRADVRLRSAGRLPCSDPKRGCCSPHECKGRCGITTSRSGCSGRDPPAQASCAATVRAPRRWWRRTGVRRATPRWSIVLL